MAITAIEFTVYIIKVETGDHVIEILLVPAAMAGGTLVVELGDFPAGWMTGATVQIFVESVQSPAAVGGMRERRSFLIAMALGAGIIQVAIIADGMDFLVGFTCPGLFLQVMTVAAIFLFVTIHAAQAEQIDMLLVVQGYDRSGLVRCRPDPHDRRCNDRV